MSKLLKAALWFVGIIISAAASTIVTALITGQPLIGLVRLKGLYETFVISRVPAWAFALVFLIAIFASYYALTHLPVSKPKGKVHFVPDSHNCGWIKQNDAEMSAQIGGTLTYEGKSTLVILQAFLKGSKPTTDMLAQVEIPGGIDRPVTASNLWLSPGAAQRTFIQMHLKPVLGKPGKPLRTKLVLRDKLNRNFAVGPIDFPYLGHP